MSGALKEISVHPVFIYLHSESVKTKIHFSGFQLPGSFWQNPGTPRQIPTAGGRGHGESAGITGMESRMKEPHKKSVANYLDPESCAGGCKVAGEALAGAHAQENGVSSFLTAVSEVSRSSIQRRCRRPGKLSWAFGCVHTISRRTPG
jgi:hypothetical protein